MNVDLWMLLRAARGPIMLIVFGTLMALNYSGTIGIERTWPVILIVLGLLKLAERAVAPPIPPPPPYPTVGGPPAPPYSQGGSL